MWLFFVDNLHLIVDAVRPDLPYVVVKIPANTAGRVIGGGGEVIKRLEGRSGVRSVDVDNGRVTVIGDTAVAVQQTVEEIRGLVTTVYRQNVGSHRQEWLHHRQARQHYSILVPGHQV